MLVFPMWVLIVLAFTHLLTTCGSPGDAPWIECDLWRCHVGGGDAPGSGPKADLIVSVAAIVAVGVNTDGQPTTSEASDHKAQAGDR